MAVGFTAGLVPSHKKLCYEDLLQRKEYIRLTKNFCGKNKGNKQQVKWFHKSAFMLVKRQVEIGLAASPFLTLFLLTEDDIENKMKKARSVLYLLIYKRVANLIKKFAISNLFIIFTYHFLICCHYETD